MLIEINSASPCPTLPPGRVPHEHRLPGSGGCVLGVIKREWNSEIVNQPLVVVFSLVVRSSC